MLPAIKSRLSSSNTPSLRRAAHLPNRSTTLYQTQKLTFKFIRTFAFSPQAFYHIYFIFNFYFYIFFFLYFFYFYLEKKKGCGEEEEGGTYCFTPQIFHLICFNFYVYFFFYFFFRAERE